MIPVIRPWIGAEEIEAVASTIESGWIAQGPKVEEFELALAAYVGAAEGVAVSSCTAGLHLALHSLGVGPGDEVIVPSLSFIASANAPRYVGATPVFADVDPITFNLTPETIKQVISTRTKAVLLVHQLGMPADIDGVRAVCRQHSLHLIEDAACAIGSTYKGDLIGRHSEVVVFSFHPRKLLTTGEGGMIMTSDPELAARMRRLRQHDMSVDAFSRHSVNVSASFDELGFNFRLTDIQASMGLVQLSRLEALVERRRRQADRYAEMFSDVDLIRTPQDPDYGSTNYQSYAIVLAPTLDREAVSRSLEAEGIATRVGVMAAHRERAFAGLAYGPLPVTEEIASRSMLLPLFHEMSPTEQDHVVQALRAACNV